MSTTFIIFVISATIQICSSQFHMVDIENTTFEFPNIFFSKNETPTPIVLWHGMGDNCCHEFRYFLNSKQYVLVPFYKLVQFLSCNLFLHSVKQSREIFCPFFGKIMSESRQQTPFFCNIKFYQDKIAHFSFLPKMNQLYLSNQVF